jgi:hypothetical protein
MLTSEPGGTILVLSTVAASAFERRLRSKS